MERTLNMANMTAAQHPLSNVQLEILKTFSYNLSEQELLEMKIILANFFAEKAIALADQAWEDKGWNNEKTEQLLKTKLRARKKT